jgi:hypothetical protein
MSRHPRAPPSPFGGPVNPPFHTLTPMESALFEADIERRPYCFLGSYLRCLSALKKESRP